MANEIKLKRGSGSDPGASDLVVGEIAIRTDTGKLFTKKDDNSIAEISGGGIDDGDKGDITVSNSGATFTIDNGVVTYAKIQNVSATNRILGRDSSGAGVIEEITPANLRTMLNVADGATNVTNTNQLTNGAGFITATLTNEQVQDIVGGMVTGNTETGITVTYQDGDGTLDFVVGTLNQDTTGNAATATALETARTIAGVSFDGTANISLNNNAITNGAGYLTSVDTSDIADDAVTFAKMQNTSNGARLLGKISSGGGQIQEQTASEVRTFLNVADGAIDGSALNASNLSSGTIPDARFPATLPAISGANLTNLPSSGLPLSGGELTGDLITHQVKPDGNNTRSLGTSSNRWSDVFTNDLHLSNKGGANQIDNSWGDFTIQEGIEDLYLINNRNGKMYKFVLQEVG